MIRVRVNGRERAVRDGLTVRELLDELGVHREGVAVAVDGQVVPRGQHGEVRLRQGQSVEVIRAVGGG